LRRAIRVRVNPPEYPDTLGRSRSKDVETSNRPRTRSTLSLVTLIVPLHYTSHSCRYIHWPLISYSSAQCRTLRPLPPTLPTSYPPLPYPRRSRRVNLQSSRRLWLPAPSRSQIRLQTWNSAVIASMVIRRRRKRH
jgi:hypothetical protein